MEKTFFSRSVALFALTAVLAGTAMAGPVTLAPGVWQTEPFTLMNPGDFFPTAYQAATGETVQVSGYYVTGDYYGIYINGKLALTTAQVSPINVDYGDQVPARYADPGSAFGSGLFSTAQFRVNAGDLITITDLYPPSGIGEVGIEAVPEPAAFGLLLIAFVGWVVGRRRTRAA